MSSQNWWANKLGAQPAAPQHQGPSWIRPMQQPQPNLIPNGQNNSTPPVVASPIERCPGCGSGNYGGATPEARKRCYDCGYPLVQSGSGLGKGINGPKAEGPTQAAKQVQPGGWNPTTIIGKLE